MKRIIVLLIAGLALTACGSKAAKVATVTQTTPAVTQTETATVPDTSTTDTTGDSIDSNGNPCNDSPTSSLPSCDNTDTSTTDTTPTPNTIAVDRGQTLNMSSLDAKMQGVSIQHQLSSDMGVKTAAGRYVVISVALTNRAHSPQSMSSTQTVLHVENGDNYTEAFEVENGVDQSSMLWQTAMNDIQPGQTIVGDFVYDVPNGVKVSNGIWGVVNFGDSVNDNSISEVGGIRLGNLS